MGIEYKYLSNESEVQQVYKLSSIKENSYMLGGQFFRLFFEKMQ